MSKKPNLTKDLYTRIPEAVTALGGVAHGEAVKMLPFQPLPITSNL